MDILGPYRPSPRVIPITTFKVGISKTRISACPYTRLGQIVFPNPNHPIFVFVWNPLVTVIFGRQTTGFDLFRANSIRNLFLWQLSALQRQMCIPAVPTRRILNLLNRNGPTREPAPIAYVSGPSGIRNHSVRLILYPKNGLETDRTPRGFAFLNGIISTWNPVFWTMYYDNKYVVQVLYNRIDVRIETVWSRDPFRGVCVKSRRVALTPQYVTHGRAFTLFTNCICKSAFRSGYTTMGHKIRVR